MKKVNNVRKIRSNETIVELYDLSEIIIHMYAISISRRTVE